MQLTEIRIAGFGGQGVILSAMVIGKAGSIFEGGFSARSTVTSDPFTSTGEVPIKTLPPRVPLTVSL